MAVLGLGMKRLTRDAFIFRLLDAARLGHENYPTTNREEKKTNKQKTVEGIVHLKMKILSSIEFFLQYLLFPL